MLYVYLLFKTNGKMLEAQQTGQGRSAFCTFYKLTKWVYQWNTYFQSYTKGRGYLKSVMNKPVCPLVKFIGRYFVLFVLVSLSFRIPCFDIPD